MTPEALAALDLSRVPVAGLPWPLPQVARIAGPSAAVLVALRLGGRRKWLPREPGPDNPLSQAVGVKTARAIAATLGGQDISWPTARAELHAYFARQLKAAGWSANRISAALQLSERRIRQLLAGVELQPRPASDGAPAAATAVDCCPVCGRRQRVRRTQEMPADPQQLLLPLEISPSTTPPGTGVSCGHTLDTTRPGDHPRPGAAA